MQIVLRRPRTPKCQPHAHHQQHPRRWLRHDRRGCHRRSHSKIILPIREVADTRVALPRKEVASVDVVVVIEIAKKSRRLEFRCEAIPPCEAVVLWGTKLLVSVDSDFVVAVKRHLCENVFNGGYTAHRDRDVVFAHIVGPGRDKVEVQIR